MLIAQSGQFLFGDEANLTPQLPGFVTLNLSTSYQLTPHVQFFASVENVTDAKYYTYRHVLADHVGVSCAGAECDQSACLQPGGADRRLWWGAHHVLISSRLAHTVDRPASIAQSRMRRKGRLRYAGCIERASSACHTHRPDFGGKYQEDR